MDLCGLFGAYTQELQKRGDEPDLRPGFEELILQWKPEPRDDVAEAVVSGESPHPMGTVASRPGSRKSAPVVQPPFEWTPKLKRQAALAGGGVVLALAGFVALTLNYDAHDGESDAERSNRIDEAMRMKPVDDGTGQPPAARPPAPPPKPLPPPVVVEEPPPRPPPPPLPPEPPELASYDVEAAPAKFALTRAHRVKLDDAAVLPGPSGTLTGLQLLVQRTQSQVKLGTRMIDVPEALAPEEPTGVVPPLLVVPGRKPTLEVALGRAKWGRADARLVALIANSGGGSTDKIEVTANGKPFAPSGALIFVDPNDRFTVRDLSAKGAWTIKVTAQPGDVRPVHPALLVVRGDKARLDGRELPGGYGVLTAGSHKLTGASSAWLTIPALSSSDVASLDVSFD